MDNNTIAKTLSKGLTKRHNLANRFRVSRFKDDFGFHVYVLENTAKREKIHIKRYLFDRFRHACKKLENSYLDGRPLPELKVFYRSQVHFIISQKLNEREQYLIQETDHRTNTVRFMSFSVGAIACINKILFHKKLYHPSDLLLRLISYHKLFSFSFTDRTNTMAGKLSFRTDLLCSYEAYHRRNIYGQKTIKVEGGAKNTAVVDLPAVGKSRGFFKSHLAEKSATSSTAIDYEKLFAGSVPEQQPEHVSTSKTAPQYLTLPLSAQEIKTFASADFNCKLSTSQFSDFLRFVMPDRHGEFLLGFEIIDCLFKQFGNIKTFKFPLYYMKVIIQESGKEISISASEDGVFYLNHLALANLVENFSKRKTVDGFKTFFKTLLAQRINVNDNTTRVYLSRTLPIREEIFTQVRKVLFGAPEDNGKGGILFDLKTVGIDVDLESVILYRGIKEKGIISASLEKDLKNIINIAHEYPQRFYTSNLGNFLSPETSTLAKSSFSARAYVPEALSKSFKLLLQKLDEHNFVLLEGPPGTGKTHSILQLLIHCICTRRKILVVSDQQSAIQALLEKLRNDIFDESDYTEQIETVLAQSIKVVDSLPKADASMAAWSTSLKNMLVRTKEIAKVKNTHDYEAQIAQIDEELAQQQQQIQDKLAGCLTARKYYETTEKDIQSILSFMRFCGFSSSADKESKEHFRQVDEYIALRKKLRKLPKLYEYFKLPSKDSKHQEELLIAREYINALLRHKPKNAEMFDKIQQRLPDNPVSIFVKKRWQHYFAGKKGNVARCCRHVSSVFFYPLVPELKFFRQLLHNQVLLLQKADRNVILQLNKIHQYLQTQSSQPSCLAYEVFFKHKQTVETEKTVHDMLLAMQNKQNERDKIIKKQLLLNLQEIAYNAQTSSQNQPSAMTIINSLIDNLSSYDSLEMALPVLNDLQEKLVQTFPIWVCRKQAVSLLFPSAENIFDLIIVDEATQCRVDDALPLLFRATKLLVVGDDKQTVLTKNSPLDDYLFFEFGLDEHLRIMQGQALKGGGSHIFGLIKQIKQASVMLDEHYRCPSDIISFSNRYVYHNDLKIMQWGGNASVLIDYREAYAETSIKPTRGVYKGLETDMLDRFLLFVAEKIKEIEKEEKRKINVENDVALCYFLLKNEPYIKAEKGKWLLKLNRGNDVLDGAGASLQGKERDYIFYLWDISKSNMLAFRQGDEDDKRKGELNVLMSRPKKRAYHYLHKEFANLNHKRAIICDYLWKIYQQQLKKSEKRAFSPRLNNPKPNFAPWRRYSGQLLEQILQENLQRKKLENHYSVNIGDPNFCIDLVLETKEMNIGIVDLARFMEEEDPAQSIVDYFFQITRAKPQIVPYFTFVSDVACNESKELQNLQKLLMSS